MVTLRRTVRFAVNLGADGRESDPGPSTNGHAGLPAMSGLGRFYEIEVACRGPADPRTGYLINIRRIDEAVREAAVPIVARAAAEHPGEGPERILPDLLAAVSGRLPVACEGLTLRLSPYSSVAMEASSPSVALVRVRFDLAASHRLHCPDLSDAENVRLFGKCNNPAGHGHNYQVEPCVEVDIARSADAPFTTRMLERATDAAIIGRFDHKNLNADTPEFADGRGVNPSVENIARVFFTLLEPEIARASSAARLRSVTVWETDRTCATFPAR